MIAFLLMGTLGCGGGDAESVDTRADSAPDSGRDTASERPALGLDDATTVSDPHLGSAESMGEQLYFTGDENVYIPLTGLDADVLTIEDAARPMPVGDVDGDGLTDFLLKEDLTNMAVYSANGSVLSSTELIYGGNSASFWDVGPNFAAVVINQYTQVFSADDLTFTTPLATFVTWPGAYIFEADMTGDGVDDHVLSTWEAPLDVGYGELGILDGSDFTVTDVHTDCWATLHGPSNSWISYALEPQDVDGDGTLDIEIIDEGNASTGSGLSIYTGITGGDIAPAGAFAHVSEISDPKILDFDDDHKWDIAGEVLGDGYMQPGVAVILGIGPGVTTFAASATWRMSEEINGFVTARVDEDEIDDLVFRTPDATYLFSGVALSVRWSEAVWGTCSPAVTPTAADSPKRG